MGIRVVYVGQSEAFWRPRPVFTSMPPLRSIERGGFIGSFIRSSGPRSRPPGSGISRVPGTAIARPRTGSRLRGSRRDGSVIRRGTS